MKKLLLLIFTVLLLTSIFFLHSRVKAPSGDSITTENNSTPLNETNSLEVEFNSNLYSTTDPDSLWVVVNKKHPTIPLDYQPGDLVTPSVELRLPENETMRLRPKVSSAVEQMFQEAEKSNLNLMISSAQRSYTFQSNLYKSYVAADGQEAADKYSARPGYSEHQTGLVLDISSTNRECELEICFSEIPEGKWLAENAYKYGFIMRYPDTLDNVTGYQFEPWHFRYVGKELAEELKSKNIPTLEEYFGIEGGATYAN